MKLSISGLNLSFGEFSLSVDLVIPSGKMTVILGPSGCGKTSLLRSIAGIQEVRSGSITLGEREITALDPRHRNIGFVFQDYALFPHMSVKKNIQYGMKGRDAEKRTDKLLELVQLSGFSERKIPELSGGEKQRVALARALASEPDLLLLDEPFSALDAKLRKSLRRQIRQIQENLHITTVYVTHDQEEALAISHNIILMNDGKIVQEGSPEQLYHQPATPFARSFIGIMNEIVLPGGETIWFRPEQCTISAASKPAAPYEGIIQYREYLGDHQLIELSTGFGIITCRCGNRPVLETGTKVFWNYTK